MMRALQARRIRGRRAVIDMLVEFVLAVVLIMIVFLVIKVAQAASFGGTNPKGTVIVESVSESIPCNYWLMNFLRAKNPAGDVFSDLLSLAKTSEDKEKFKAAATDSFSPTIKGISRDTQTGILYLAGTNTQLDKKYYDWFAAKLFSGGRIYDGTALVAIK